MQQSHAPRPLPLFLELVRIVSQTQPELAAKALDGLARYEEAPRARGRAERPSVSTVRPARARDCGGDGPPVLLVPSLINPPNVLDLDERVSLADAIAEMGRRVFLLDWGPARQRSGLGLGGHVTELLVPLLGQFDRPPALLGYCLGGTMAIAAAQIQPVEAVVTLAAPWRFCAYPHDARDSLQSLWASSKAAAAEMQVLPMEVLQSAFWSLDPLRTVAKFADFAELERDSAAAQRFVTLEDWANEGEPLPYPAARELIEDLFGRDLPGSGEWRVGERPMTSHLDCPVLHIAAANDRITPAPAAPPGESIQIEAGHVGMVVGSARTKLHQALAKFLGAPCR